MLHTLRFFFSSKFRLFHNAAFFGSCVIHILHTGCAKIKKKSGAEGLIKYGDNSTILSLHLCIPYLSSLRICHYVCRARLTHNGIKHKITSCEGLGSNHESSANALGAVKKNTHTQ